MNHNNTSTQAQKLATAPEIPSSINYYDPRNYNNYMSPNNPSFLNPPSPHLSQPTHAVIPTTAHTPSISTSNTIYNTNYMNPTANTTKYPYNTNHLPPLSHLLPTTNNNNNNKADLPSNRKNSTVDSVDPHPQERQSNYYYVPSNVQPSPPSVPSQKDLSFRPSLPPNVYTNQLYHSPSPPNSDIDGVLITNPSQFQPPLHYPPYVEVSPSSSQKVFSFVPLPGLNQKKRPRRKFHEVERLYQCNYQNCTKAYGTLNHLNAHVSMQRHGSKRQPSEFKELRKMWRKLKRENKQCQSEQNQQENENMNYMLTTTTPIYHPTPWNNRNLQLEFMPPSY